MWIELFGSVRGRGQVVEMIGMVVYEEEARRWRGAL
jgi:hypothetical protein